MADITKKKIWAVFPATGAGVELVDVLYETTVHKLALVAAGMFARGAHKDWDGATFYDSEADARADAEKRLAKAQKTARSDYDRR
jgi:hypothetical protein